MKKRIPTTPDATTALPNAFDAFGLSSIGLPEGPAQTPPSEASPKKKGKAILRKETAHRGGKTVVVIYGFEAHLSDDYLESLLKKLKNTCGCGGALKERELELQGLNVARIRETLTQEGFQVAGIKA